MKSCIYWHDHEVPGRGYCKRYKDQVVKKMDCIHCSDKKMEEVGRNEMKSNPKIIVRVSRERDPLCPVCRKYVVWWDAREKYRQCQNCWSIINFEILSEMLKIK